MRIEHWRYSIPLWVRGLFRRHDVEQEIDDEIRDHIEQQTRTNMAAGMSAADAKRAALVAFGGVQRVKEESRDARRLSLIDNLSQVRYAARSLLRARTFTIATVATIALAVGAGSAIATLINTVLLRPLPYADSDRIVAIWNSMPGINMPLMRQAPGIYLADRDGAKSLDGIGVFTGEQTLTVAFDEPSMPPQRVTLAAVTPSIFGILRAHPLLGSLPTTENDADAVAPRTVVVGERFWREQLSGKSDVIGQHLHIEGLDMRIVAVVPASFAFPGNSTQLWAVIKVQDSQYLGSFVYRSIARLRPGATAAAAQRELQSILMHTPERFAEQRAGVSTARMLEQTRASAVVHTLRRDAIGGFEQVLWLIAAVVAVLVLVALSNVASLVLARVDAHQRELAVRATLGASAARLWWGVMAEMGIVAGAGGAIGLTLGYLALKLLTHGGATQIVDPILSNAGRVALPRLNEIRPDPVFVLVGVLLTAAFCIIAAAIGASRIQWSDAGRVLRDGGRYGTAGRASQRLRATFVALEVALSLVLLSGSAVLARSLWRLFSVPTGFDTRNVVSFWTPLPRTSYTGDVAVTGFYHDAVARIERVPGVIAAGVVSKLPLESSPVMRAIWVEDAPAAAGVLPPIFSLSTASEGYFRAAGIQLLAGRSFDRAIVARRGNEAVVGQGFAIQYWADSTGRRALGRRMRPYAEGPWYTIVGVVGDVRDTSLTAQSTPVLYLPEEPPLDPVDDNRPRRDMAFVVRTRGDVPDIAATLEREIHAVNPNVPVTDFAPLSEYVAKASSRLTFVLYVLAIGAATTLALGIVGLYGVIAYVVSLRSREIGIRIALGLTPANAARMILKQGEGIVVIGALVGGVAFVAFAKLLNSLVFEVSAVDGVALAGSAALVVAVATLATWIPARRAAQIDPAQALKAD